MGSTSSSRSSSKLIHRVGVVAGLRPHKTNRVQQHVPCCAVRPSGLLLSEQKFQFRLRTSCEFRQRRQAIRSGCPLMESWGRSTGNTTHATWQVGTCTGPWWWRTFSDTFGFRFGFHQATRKFSCLAGSSRKPAVVRWETSAAAYSGLL